MGREEVKFKTACVIGTKDIRELPSLLLTSPVDKTSLNFVQEIILSSNSYYTSSDQITSSYYPRLFIIRYDDVIGDTGLLKNFITNKNTFSIKIIDFEIGQDCLYLIFEDSANILDVKEEFKKAVKPLRLQTGYDKSFGCELYGNRLKLRVAAGISLGKINQLKHKFSKYIGKEVTFNGLEVISRSKMWWIETPVEIISPTT